MYTIKIDQYIGPGVILMETSTRIVSKAGIWKNLVDERLFRMFYPRCTVSKVGRCTSLGGAGLLLLYGALTRVYNFVVYVCAHIRGMVVINYSTDIEISSAEHAYAVNYTLLNDLMVNFR